MDRCELHCHDEWSNPKLRDSIVKLEDLVKRAIEYGSKGVAVTNHEIIGGHIRALELQDKIQKTNPDFKIMLGNEIYLIDETEYKNTNQYYHFLLIAKNKKGHEQLRELSTRAWARSYMERGMLRTPTFYQDFEEVIGNNKGNLISSSACLGGKLAKTIIAKDSVGFNEFIQWMINTFGKENCFLEMQDSDSIEQQQVNQTIVKASGHFDIDYIITSDIHYLDKKDISIHHAFLNSKEEDDRETETFYKYTYLKPTSEIMQILSYLPQTVIERGISNTMKIYDKIEKYDIRHSVIIPSRKPAEFELQHILKPWYNKYSAIKDFAYSEEEQDRYLLHLIEQGIIEKQYEVTEEIAERINTELDVVWYISSQLNQRLSAYLTLVKNIIDIIWEVSFVGISRGSAACFLINYLIDIVQMNPLEYNIPYWRFSSKDRVDLFDIDIDVNPEKVPQIISLLRQHYGDDNVLNCLTLKTESLKSAILTACRGLGVPVEEAQVISSMVPVERGRVLSFKECIYGDEEKGISPVQGFEKALRNYENLYEVVEKIEGLISGRGIHASALYIFNNGYLVQNSLCKAPNGTPITAFNMSDSDSMGALKFDLLSTELQTKLMKTFELLLADGVIEWQGSLRETYNKYLHPKVLEYNNPEMWRKAADGEIVNIFQFEGVTGQACIRKTRPTSVAQMGAANAVMRLMSENGGQTPIDRYVAFKNNIKLWYKEMAEAGVLPEEYPILEKHLLHKFGCSIEQEDFMMIVADPKISNFTLKESNGLRKAIAKKKLAMLEEYKQKFFEKGTQAGTRQAFLDYVWTYCIQALAGYSFSVPHDIAYSLEALQQMNLCTRYNPLYWQCACLSVNAGSLETDFEILGDEEEEAPSVTEESDDEEEVKARVVTTNYGKVAKAIGEIQSQGVKILLPDINKSRVDFIPVITENAIMYGMQAINSVNIDMINNIIDKRPYFSIEDFMMKNTLTNIQMINLIKAGSFDIIEKKTRPYIMNKYLLINAMTKIARKTNLTMSNYSKMAEYKVIPKQFEQTNKLICFKKWIDKNCLVKGADNRKRYMLTEADVIKFFSIIIMDSMTLGKDYDTIPNGFGVKVSAFEKFYNTLLQPLKDWMASEEAVETFYQAELSAQIAEWSHKYCKGSIGKWEMDSIGCYVSLHELAKVNNTRYGIKDFRSLPEIAKPTSFKTNKKTGVEYPVYALCRIAGTVLNADKAKHIVSLLTVFGVVDVKFYKMAFIQYNKRISKMMPNGKKAVIENSWFTRGNKLIISGFRRENLFVPRTDYEAGFKTTVQLIEDVSNGELTLKTQREKE